MEKVTVTLNISGMHCSSCAINIDFELEDLEGVEEAKTHYAKQISVISYYPEKVSEDQLIEIIKKLGYQVQNN